MRPDNADGDRETGLYEIVGLSEAMNISGKSLWQSRCWRRLHVYADAQQLRRSKACRCPGRREVCGDLNGLGALNGCDRKSFKQYKS